MLIDFSTLLKSKTSKTLKSSLRDAMLIKLAIHFSSAKISSSVIEHLLTITSRES